jgi:DNA-binding SARP family transcriptional activator/tetratricopeptide (TPR) repeat protein
MIDPGTGVSADVVRFGLLGPLLVADGAGEIAVLPAAKQRIIMAALLLSANTTVSSDKLTQILWEVSPPPSAATAVRNYVMRLRRLVGPAGARIVGRQGGYAVEVRGPAELDLAEVDLLRRDAQAAAAAGRWSDASCLCSAALSLWRGEPLADVPSPVLAQRELTRLAELRLQLTEARIDADLRLARHSELIAELRQLAAEHPLREHMRVQLMLACYRCGRQAEALATYQETRALLIDELGVEPGPELQGIQRRILAADPGLMVVAAAPTTSAVHLAPRTGPQAAPDEPLVPRQLPASVRHFTGRAAELGTLTTLLDEVADGTDTVLVAAIGGAAGMGKTTLAVHWAHLVADRFPDGQLFIDLRGFDPLGQPIRSADAIRSFLEALHVNPRQVPASTQAQADMYRTVTAGRRMLIVLDNACDAAQIRPLIPGGPRCAVIITSRSELTALAVGGAHVLNLGVLTEAEGINLLSVRIGTERVQASRGAAADMVRLCARLPLAIAIVAARVAASPGSPPLSGFNAELRDARTRLDMLTITGDATADMRAIFSWSYRSLSSPAAATFRLLGVHPGPDISVRAAASLADIPPDRARIALAELAGANLLSEHSAGRFAFHDLLRAYAAECALAENSDDERAASVRRVLDYYLHTAWAANRLLNPARDPITLPPAAAGAAPEELVSHDQALSWFEAEHRVLIAAMTLAAETGFRVHAWQIPWTLADFLERQGHWQDWVITQRTGLTAARQLGDRATQARAHRGLGFACARLGSYPEAHAHLTQALTLFREADDKVGQARAHQDLSWTLDRQGQLSQALNHDQQALSLFKETGHTRGQATALNSIGWLCTQSGDHHAAVDSCLQALQLHHALGNHRGEAATWDSLGYARHHLHEHTEALACYGRSLEKFRELGDRLSQAEVLTHLGETYLVSGRRKAAGDVWREALRLLEDLGHSDADQIRAKLHSLTGG